MRSLVARVGSPTFHLLFLQKLLFWNKLRCKCDSNSQDLSQVRSGSAPLVPLDCLLVTSESTLLKLHSVILPLCDREVTIWRWDIWPEDGGRSPGWVEGGSPEGPLGKFRVVIATINTKRSWSLRWSILKDFHGPIPFIVRIILQFSSVRNAKSLGQAPLLKLLKWFQFS